MTNYHVIGNEETASKGFLEFEGANNQIDLKELLEKDTFTCSDVNTVIL